MVVSRSNLIHPRGRGAGTLPLPLTGAKLWEGAFALCTHHSG